MPSCIKEIIENSLDAKSSKIDICVIEFGKEKIEVRDNGFFVYNLS